MAAPFSSSDEAIINSIVPLSQLTLSSSSKAQNVDVDTLYDVQNVAKQLRKHHFRRVALQFPDELLCDASAVYWALESALRQGSSSQPDTTLPDPVELYVLADTSYGNCCVDEVAAEHVEADVVVHFGHACLSPTSRLPCIYVFHRLPIDVQHCTQAFTDLVAQQQKEQNEEKRLVLMYDVGYEHACENIHSSLCSTTGKDIHLSRMDKDINWHRYVESKSKAEPRTDTVNGTAAELTTTRKNILPDDLSPADMTLLYVGPESLALTNLLLSLGPSVDVIRYDATLRKACRETGRTNKLLQRRYAAVQKARDAQTVGILVGTLGLRSYLPLLQHLREHLTQRQGKRVYTISVGKLNPAKLANFQEIDVFVLVACPENSLVDAAAGLGAHDSRDFFRPIVTPFELLTAFKGRDWTGEYELDLERVYAQAQEQEQANGHSQSLSENGEDEETPHFSLVTGGLVSSRHRSNGGGERLTLNGTDGIDDRSMQHVQTGNTSHDALAGIVTVRAADGTLTRVMESAGAAHLATRSWRGLEQRTGMDEPAALETGRSGIAKGYKAGDEAKNEGS